MQSIGHNHQPEMRLIDILDVRQQIAGIHGQIVDQPAAGIGRFRAGKGAKIPQGNRTLLEASRRRNEAGQSNTHQGPNGEPLEDPDYRILMFQRAA